MLIYKKLSRKKRKKRRTGMFKPMKERSGGHSPSERKKSFPLSSMRMNAGKSLTVNI
jgi:hypothetical protein